ncbi:MAG: hypothetical protein ACU0CO_13620 [Shimia sp.]
MQDGRTYTWRGGLDALRKLAARRQRPFLGVDDVLPPADVDLAPYRDEIVQPFKLPTIPVPRGHALGKYKELSDEFEGRPHLLLLHGFVIAVLRHDDPPPAAAALFQRLWAEEGAALMADLDVRWMISAVATFRDHGTTEAQRRTGMALSLLFNLVKLYETERQYSGRRPGEPFAPEDRAKHPMALDMAPFSVQHGDLDRNLLLYVWEDAEATDPVLRPLALHLLDTLNADRRTVFRRLKRMRAKMEGGEG